MKALSPTGTEIIGTLEQISGRAEIVPDSFHRDESGEIMFEHAGGTEIFWDDQETVTRYTGIIVKGEKQRVAVYLDENGDEWLETQLKLVDDDNEENETTKTNDIEAILAAARDMAKTLANDNDSESAARSNEIYEAIERYAKQQA